MLVGYHEDDWWHERVILGFLGLVSIVVATPHWDLYVEDWADFASVHHLLADGSLPPGARFGFGADRAGRVVRFARAQLARRLPGFLRQALVAEPTLLADLPGSALTGVGAPPGGALAGVGAPVLPVSMAADPSVADPVAPAAPATAIQSAAGLPALGGGASAGGGAADALVWVAMESRGGLLQGAPVDPQTWTLYTHGDRGVAEFGAVRLAIGLLGSTADASGTTPRGGPAKDEPGDLRTLPVLYDVRNERSRDFAGTVLELSETSFAHWPLRGPRTCQWLLNAIRQQGHTPAARHSWWRQCLGLATVDEGVEEHGILSDLLEAAVTFDALNISELMSFELLSRRYQVWEQYYKNSLRQAASGLGHSSALDAEERDLFMGQRYGRGTALVSPDLEEHVAEVLRDRSAIQKERRKAREERVLQPPQTQPGPKRGARKQGKAGAAEGG